MSNTDTWDISHWNNISTYLGKFHIGLSHYDKLDIVVNTVFDSPDRCARVYWWFIRVHFSFHIQRKSLFQEHRAYKDILYG